MIIYGRKSRNMIMKIINFFTPIRLFIYGVLLAIPAVIFNLRVIFNDTPKHFRVVTDSIIEKFEIPMMIGLYVGVMFLFFSLLKNKNINKKYFFYAPIIMVLILGILSLGGLLRLPRFCENTYYTHGDSEWGPVYIETWCASYTYPWQVSFWPRIITGKIQE